MENFEKFYLREGVSDCFGITRRLASKLPGEPIIVHGKIITAEGKTIDHAWLEVKWGIIEPTFGNETTIMNKHKYYKALNAVPEAKYTWMQANINMVRSGNLGPWTKEEVGDRFIWRKDV